MEQDPIVANDVYQRYGLKWADFPSLATPSAHSDEAELFCAKQSMAVYAAYPNVPYAPAQDYIPSKQREAIAAGTFAVGRMIEGGGETPARSFDEEQGYRVVVSDRAAALLVWKHDHLVIAFRGTANWQDWIHNFTGAAITTDLVDLDDNIRLHKGFTGLAENIAPAVKELIAEFLRKRGDHDPSPTLTLCGHSLGGALALNFAARLRRWIDHDFLYDHFGRQPIRLGATYTFGAPRIAKGRVWQYIRRPHYRLIINGDPVPATPPGFDSDFEAAYLAKPLEKARQPNSKFGKIWKGIRLKLTPNLDFSAHDIETYIDAITEKIAAKTYS
jgi:pimeloyl-ACP methyl ester carboxylesterase